MIARFSEKLRNMNKLFLGTVVAPTLLALIYYGLIASNVFISESRFVVRSPDKQSASGIGIILRSAAGVGNSDDEIFAAQAYVSSRDALRELNRKGQFESAYSKPGISLFDRFDPTGLFGSFEDLYRYYQSKVAISYDAGSSMATLQVRAYSPDDALFFNERLLEITEATVNTLNTRARQDLIRFGQLDVDDAKAKARSAALALSAYRNVSGVVDPERQADVQLQMVAKLQDELVTTKTQLTQLRAFAPRNPQIPVLQDRAASLQREINDQIGRVAGDRKSLSATAAQYQRLLLESQFADRQLASTLSSLEEARNEARRKQAYVERIVSPNKPDAALEPHRIRGVFSIALMGLIAFAILSMLLAGVKEHQD